MFMYDPESGKLLDDDEAQIAFCMKMAGVSESQARFILAIEKGEITGDKIVEVDNQDVE